MSEIVNVWILLNETEHLVSEMTQLFKYYNTDSSKLEVIVADKDMTERKTFAAHFPNADIQICLFHTLRTFRRELTTKKMSITQEQEARVKQIIQDLVYSKSENDYDNNYKMLKGLKIQSVSSYYEENWHGIRQEWVEGLKSMKKKFNNRTNNRVESMNQKLKSVISTYSGMVQFFKDLLSCLKSFSIERNHKAVELINKVSINSFHDNQDKHFYHQFLTPYAFHLVNQQFQFVNSVKLLSMENETSARFDTNSGVVLTEICSCQCSFYMSLRLPCRHILKLRMVKALPVFVEDICHFRWTRPYYYRTNYALNQIDHAMDNSAFTSSTVLSTKGKQNLTSNQMYRNIMSISQGIATSCSLMSAPQYSLAENCLKKLSDLLREGKLASVKEILPFDQDLSLQGEQLFQMIYFKS